MFGSLNLGRFLLATVATLIVSFVYGLVIHGHVLSGVYGDTHAVALTSTALALDGAFIVKLLTLMTIVFIFTRNFEDKGTGEGVRFGVLIGLLLGLLHVDASTILSTGVIAIIDMVVYGIVLGITLSLVYGSKKI